MKKILLLFFFLISIYAVSNAQDKKISGTVIGKSDKLPLPGVSVKVEGTSIGMTTDSKGQFLLSVPNGAVLVFSSIGYVTQKISVGDKTSFQIALEDEANKLEDVVITSFGIQRDKKTIGYGVSTVTSEKLTKAPTPDVSNALAGKVAGVQVSGSGGAFNSSNITIRGFSSITRSNQPLYVIDGVPVDNSGGGNSVNAGSSTSSRGSDINPEDIESMSVLKGAAATVLYGSRAASGVILITTKKGKSGTRAQVSFTSSANIGTINIFPEFQNEYAQGTNGIYGTVADPFGWSARSTSWGPRIAGQQVTNIIGQKVALQAYPDNVRDILQNSFGMDNTINFSGASDKFNYRVSYGNSTTDALVPGNKLDRNNLTVNAGTNITDKFKISTSFSYVNNISDRTQAGNQGANPLWRAIYTPRSYDIQGLPVTDLVGNQIWHSTSEENPYWSIDHITRSEELNRFYGNINLKYDFTNWLQADLKVGADVFSISNTGFDDKGVRSNANTSSIGAGGLIQTRNMRRNLNSYLTLTGNKTYGDFNLSMTVGNEIISNYANNLSTTGKSIIIPGFVNLSNFTNFSSTDSYSKNRLMGFFGDLSVQYKTWLNVNVKARNDYSSTLIAENRSIFYPAVAVSFVPTEAWPELKSKALNSLKIRVNGGEVGKGGSPYETGTYYVTASSADGFSSTTVNFPFNGLAGFTYANGSGNPLLMPEFTREFELGTDIAMFDNRLNLDFSVYQRDSRNLIFDVPVARSSGFTSRVANAGKLSTKGLEFLLSGVPVKTENFTWEASLNFTKFKSIVKELAPGVDLISLGGFTSPNIQAVAGQEYGLIYSNRYLRDAQGRMIIKANGLPQATSDVGVVGNPNPKFTAGLTNSFKYKAFSFSFLLDFKYKGDVMSRTIGDLRINGVAAETAEFDRFNADGTVSKPYLFEGVYADGTPNKTYVSAQEYWGLAGKYVSWEGYVLDATFLKLREATFSYDFPKELIAKTKFISKLQLSIYGRNLWTYAPNFPHLDPEQNLLGISNARGLEFGITPVSKVYGATLRATF
ncbi:SusC/RagA family TonB-linked outer membrane protein [Pedobacter punctiformis]|uniref:SusC/RagA family TonB-linked outer membrane protein n=1 Tax=Pedobacter punctiformis TaxID=3004097 RepID=A0ABT4LAZ2_9SPHI|nr:SusC/RagA family TonB-linked outer membrane protein [Pedobacter sp. HCMS5-2]MCZ4245092.1 SusC/RagA family TonB-linked outer membrane protein [Pedobacter sp. HCMS5-2]